MDQSQGRLHSQSKVDQSQFTCQAVTGRDGPTRVIAPITIHLSCSQWREWTNHNSPLIQPTGRMDQPESLHQSQFTSHSFTGRMDQSDASIVADDSFTDSTVDGTDFEVIDVNVAAMESSKLHELLSEVDPQMASKLHPNDKRKIIR